MAVHNSHTFDGFPSSSAATDSYPAPATPSSSSPRTSNFSLSPSPMSGMGKTPLPSPSRFLKSYASEPRNTNTRHQLLRRPYTTIRGVWHEHRSFRRFLLVFMGVMLPTLLIAAYSASAAGTYRGRTVAMKHGHDVPIGTPILGPDPIRASNVASAGAGEQDEADEGQARGYLHQGLKRRWTGVAPRQVSTSVDNADAPILSLVGGLGNSRSTTSSSSTSQSAPLSSSSLSPTPTTTLPSTTIAPSVPATPILPTPFVQPFDTTLSTDFLSATCQTYFTNLTQLLSFRQCRPFSLLLSTSQDFLSSQTNLTLLTSIIYGTCNTTPSLEECTNRMDALGNELRAVCAEELGAGHALTWDALNGMKNYKMMREAACLRNLRTNSYCFADAVVATPPSDIYFYQLPLGTPIPGTSSTSSADGASPTSTSANSNPKRPTPGFHLLERALEERALGPFGMEGGGGSNKGIIVTPTCSACTQSLMGIFASYATNSSLLISGTYSAAQRAVEVGCGSGYAAVVSSGAASVAVSRPMAAVYLTAVSMVLIGVPMVGAGL